MTAMGLARRIGEIILPLRWDLAGFALSRAHATALLAFAASEVWVQGVSLGMRVAMLLCATSSAMLVALAAPGRPEGHGVSSWALALVGAAGAAAVAWGVSYGAGFAALVGFALTGVCAGYFESVWGRRFVGMRNDRIQSYTLLATALSSILGIALGLVGGGVFFLLTGLLPLAAAALFVTSAQRGCTAREMGMDDVASDGVPACDRPVESAQETSEHRVVRERRHRALINILVCCLVFSAIYNMVVVLAYDFMPPQSASQVRFAANLLCALGLLALSLFLKPLSSVSMLRLVLPVTAVGFVLYLLAPQPLGWVSLTVSGIGRKLFDILTWVLVAQAVTAHAAHQPDRYFGFLIACKNMGYLLGLLLAAVTLMYDPGVVQMVTAVPILLLVLIVLFVWVFPERTIDQLFSVVEAPQRPAGRGLDEKVIAVASACGCTPRETEVLALLARGRTQAVIAQRLGISAGTAHTHIMHVYQKLGVGRQQELIEKVELVALDGLQNTFQLADVSSQPFE